MPARPPPAARRPLARCAGRPSSQLGAPAVKSLALLLVDGRLPALEELDLRGNRLATDAGLALAHALFTRRCAALRLLDLRSNALEDPACAGLAAAARAGVCPALELLNVRDNRMSTELQRRLAHEADPRLYF